MTTPKTSHYYPENHPENTPRAQAKPLVQQRTSQSNDASELPGARTTTTTNSLSHTTSQRQPIHPGSCGQLCGCSHYNPNRPPTDSAPRTRAPTVPSPRPPGLRQLPRPESKKTLKIRIPTPSSTIERRKKVTAPPTDRCLDSLRAAARIKSRRHQAAPQPQSPRSADDHAHELTDRHLIRPRRRQRHLTLLTQRLPPHLPTRRGRNRIITRLHIGMPTHRRRHQRIHPDRTLLHLRASRSRAIAPIKRHRPTDRTQTDIDTILTSRRTHRTRTIQPHPNRQPNPQRTPLITRRGRRQPDHRRRNTKRRSSRPRGRRHIHPSPTPRHRHRTRSKTLRLLTRNTHLPTTPNHRTRRQRRSRSRRRPPRLRTRTPRTRRFSTSRNIHRRTR